MATDWSQYEVKNPEGKTSPDWSQYAIENGQEESVGLGGVGQDIWSGIKEVPGAIGHLATSLPSEAYGAGKQLLTDPKRVGQNALAGLSELGHGLINTPANIADYLSRKEFINPSYEGRFPRQQEHDFASMVGREGSKPGDALLSSLVESIPYLLGGELGLAKGFGRTAQRGAALGAQAIGQDQNPVTAALMPAGIEGALGLAGNAGRALTNTPVTPTGIAAKAFRGKLSPEELLANQRVAEGTNTSLGNVVQSPYLRQLHENTLPNILGSNGYEGIAKIGSQVEGKAGDLIEKIGEGIPSGDPNLAIKDALVKAHEDQRVIKNELYSSVNTLEKKEGFKAELPKFEEQAKDLENSLAQSVLREDKTINALYKKAVAINEGASPLSISEVKQLRQSLYDQARNYRSSASASERNAGKALSDMAKSLTEDLNESVKKYGSPELQDALKTADKNYKENYSEWLDEFGTIASEKDAQTLAREIMKGGKSTDKSTRIEKIQNLLPDNMKNSIGYAYLQNAFELDGKLNPAKLRNSINKLGPRQFESLFPDPALRQMILDYEKLSRMNEYPLRTMQNPPTGKSLANALGMAHVAGSAAAGMMSPALGVASLVAPPLLSRAASNALESPAFREKTIQKMIKNDEKKSSSQKSQARKDLEERMTIVIPYTDSESKKNKQGKQ